MLKIVIGLMIGGAIGAFIGWKGRCTTGACPLTSNPIAGGLYGALLGSMFAGLWACTPSDSTTRPGGAASQENETPVATQQSEIVVIDTVAAFDTLVSEAGIPVLVDFWATWCPPCQTQGKVLNDMADEVGGRMIIAKVDVDQIPELAARYQIELLPTLVLFEDGKRKTTLVGLHRKDKLLAKIGL